MSDARVAIGWLATDSCCLPACLQAAACQDTVKSPRSDKPQKAWRTDGYFTVGDAGYLDADGYLFLCDRKADLIISGGVNIYPAEIESVLSEHPRVLDVGKLKKRLLRDPWWEGRQRRF